MTRKGMNEELKLIVRQLPNAPLKELIETAKLLGSPHGPAWLAMLRRIRKDGLPKPPRIIRVNRSATPLYPPGLKSLVFPEFERSGPSEYDLTTLEQHLFGRQNDGGCEVSHDILERLKVGELISRCLNLQDALAIQRMGIDVFRECFKGKSVFFWKSVIRSNDSLMRVPFLVEARGDVSLEWHALAYACYGDDPALLFPRQDT